MAQYYVDVENCTISVETLVTTVEADTEQDAIDKARAYVLNRSFSGDITVDDTYGQEDWYIPKNFIPECRELYGMGNVVEVTKVPSLEEEEIKTLVPKIEEATKEIEKATKEIEKMKNRLSQLKSEI